MRLGLEIRQPNLEREKRTNRHFYRVAYTGFLVP